MTHTYATQAPTFPARSAAPAEDRTGVLDNPTLADLARLDPTGANRLLQRVLTTYRGSLERLLSQLAHARRQSDLAVMRLATHTLKSSSASVGALCLSRLCGEAEQAIRESQVDGLADLLDQLVAEAARVDGAVLKLLSDD